ncbi:hypothetical protein WH52_14300 [Tenacibaculum holothuriorum]|uniref:Thiamine biosynthesis protein ThiS n=1 Tax=Tenacibaculum holothuriorum TaxID=1635173 RepID=A0A1Y2PAU4_9FLAO|nr:sulfur carrier protein ThiS [Tenacibaculum holothuriorum]OSY86848.1 hypothetical protein WH52_14300 [Tenacibaculum holothuriorum]
MITVNLNQEQYQLNNESSVQDFINHIQVSSNGIAIAINQQIISKANWNKQKLQNGDSILIIKATQGG